MNTTANPTVNTKATTIAKIVPPSNSILLRSVGPTSTLLPKFGAGRFQWNVLFSYGLHGRVADGAEGILVVGGTVVVRFVRFDIFDPNNDLPPFRGTNES